MKLADVWDKRQPVFLLSAEFSLRRSLSLIDIIKRVCLDLNIDPSLVELSYCQYFLILNNSLNLEEMYNLINGLKDYWGLIASQANYNQQYTLDIYGTYCGTLKSNKYKYKHLVALGPIMSITNSVEELNPVTFHKAVHASYLALPI